MAAEQPLPPSDPPFRLTRSMVLPFVGGRSAWSQEYLPAVFATLIMGVLLFATPIPGIALDANEELNTALQINVVVALYIAFMVSYFIYRMCLRARPWWLMLAVAALTLVLMQTELWHHWYTFFYTVIPGTQWEASSNPWVVYAGNVFGTGLCEESFKALPLLGLALLGGVLALLARGGKGRLSKLFAGIRKRIGLLEPLDGITLGVASGCGFALTETLGQYLPNVMKGETDISAKAFDGLALLLARGASGHIAHPAWAGLFGYFIGLSVLRPRAAIFLLPLGWLSPALLHGTWDAVGSTKDSMIILPVMLFVGLFAYALLGGAIIKAREISPRLALGPAGQGAPLRPGAGAPAEESAWAGD